MHASVVLLASALLLPAAPPNAEDPDTQARFVAGLVEKGLFERAADEAEVFLRDHADHELAADVRYRLATALFELGRPADAVPHLE
jgi:hypothetical protein